MVTRDVFQLELEKRGVVQATTDPVTGVSTFSAGGSPILALGHVPSLRSAFNDVIGSISPKLSYVFGSSATSSDGAVVINSLDALAENFQPWMDVDGTTTISSELEQYVPFGTASHEIASDRLNLAARLPGGQWGVTVSQIAGTVNLDGTATVIANLGLANTTGLRVGQFVAVQGNGGYYISALVANTSVTLTNAGGSPTTAVASGLVAFLPIDSAVTNTAHAGNNVLTFASTPAGAVVGASVAYSSGSQPVCRSGDWRVKSVASGVVTLDCDTGETIGSGARIVFLPIIESGQIWTKQGFDISAGDRFFAVEVDVDMYAGGSTADTKGVNTLAAFSALPTTVPWGAWPALWLYSINSENGGRDGSEIDVMEQWIQTTEGINLVMGANHGNGIIKDAFYRKVSDGWTDSGFGFSKSPSPLAGALKYQCIYTGGRLYRYINGELIKADLYEWTSEEYAQFGVNMAFGSMLTWIAAALGVPFSPSSFTGAKIGVKSMKIWHQGNTANAAETVSQASAAAPVISTADIDATDPTKINLKFDKPLNRAFVPSQSAFSLTNSAGADTVSAVSVDGKFVTLTKSRTNLAGQIVTLSYTPPASNALSGYRYGKPVSAVSGRSVTNPLKAIEKVRLTTFSNITESGNGTTGWIYTSTAGAFFASAAGYALRLAGADDGYFEATLATIVNGDCVTGLKTSNTTGAWGDFKFAIQISSGAYKTIKNGSTGGNPNTATITPAVGDIVRISRESGVIYGSVSKDSGATFTKIHNFGYDASQLWACINADTSNVMGPLRQSGMS